MAERRAVRKKKRRRKTFIEAELTRSTTTTIGEMVSSYRGELQGEQQLRQHRRRAISFEYELSSL
jgi:hypothetical protein